MIKAFRLIILGACLSVFVPVRASFADTIRLDSVVVSVIPFQDSHDEATGSLHILLVDKVAKLEVVNPSDLLNRVPGVYMASGTNTTNRLVIRGVGSRTPYSSNRIRTYLDEIPMNTGDGVSTLEDIEMAGIGSIDILKGPSSALYGSGLGGVVLLQPHYPENQGLSLSMGNELGGFGSSRNLLSAAYKGNKLVLHAVISHSASDGYRQNSEFTRNNIFLNARYFGKRNSLSFIFSYTGLYGQIPSSLNEEDFLSDPSLAAGNWLAVEGFEQYSRLLGGLKLRTRISEGLSNTLVVFGGSNDPYESRPFNILDDNSVSAGFRDHLNWELGTIKLRAGMEYFHEWYAWKIYETNGGEQGIMLSHQKEQRRYLNTFAFLKWELAENLILDAGFNLNFLNYDLETVFRLDSLDNSGAYSYDPVFSPRIGLNFCYLPTHYFFAAAGHGFSAPSLEETLLPDGLVNTELRPESGWNIELGTRGRLWNERLRYELAFYTIFLDDLLVTERVSEEIFTGMNAGSARNLGLEFLAGVWLSENRSPTDLATFLSVGLSLSDNRFLDFVDLGVDYSGKQLPGIPGTIFQSSLQASYRGLDARMSYRYTGAQWLTDGNELSYEGYHLLNLRVAWKYDIPSLPLGFEIYSGIRNLLDAEYASMILVNAPSFGSNAPRYYYPGMPRQFYAGLVLNFRSK